MVEMNIFHDFFDGEAESQSVSNEMIFVNLI